MGRAGHYRPGRLDVVLKLWLSPCCPALRNASLTASVPVASPYVFVYGLAVLVPACAFLAGSRGFLALGAWFAALVLLAVSADARDLTKVKHLSLALAAGTFA